MNVEYKAGDIRNGSEVLPKGERKKILILSDDLRLASGVATMTKEFVLGIVHRFEVLNLGAAIKHPEHGTVMDVSKDVQQLTGISDASVRILAWDGYGNADLIRQLITTERPDVILHFTDPRYWLWLYEIEHEIRQHCPLVFYTIWDDLPLPLWNAPYYASCDGLFCISKQTYGLVTNVMNEMYPNEYNIISDLNQTVSSTKKNVVISYVPHGINEELYKPVDVSPAFRNKILKGGDYEFVLYWNNRNIRRKQPSDVIYAFKVFCDRIGKAKASKVCLLMHTQPIDENGTDLPAVIKAIAPDCNIIFSEDRLNQDELNMLYNISDVTINIANNEGFGLTTAESVMAGTPIIVNVTGGLQDQCGFTLEGKSFTADDYVKVGSFHKWREWESKLKHGDWVMPIWSRALSLAGSPLTPYIWDDRVDPDEVADVIQRMYETPASVRKSNALKGREAFINEMGLSANNMSEQMINSLETVITNWTPTRRYKLIPIK